jgi:trehalose 6-phosphate synthase
MLRELRPGALISHFNHIPFAPPSGFATLPRGMREEILAGMLGADVIGFHTARWARHFLECCRDLARCRVNMRRSTVGWRGRTARVRVHPISVDVQDLREKASAPEVVARSHRMERWLGDSRLVLRVDRADLSKNILRGLLAFEAFVAGSRAWRGRVHHLALLNPSREALPEYREYARACLREADRINRRFGDDRWQPIRVQVRDDVQTSLAAFGLYDVLLVNPVIDGLNLVAKEGPILNQRNGVLILSENAGSIAELGRHVLSINPFDVGETARAIATSLEMPVRQRARRAAGLRDSIERNRLEDWVGSQLADLDQSADQR